MRHRRILRQAPAWPRPRCSLFSDDAARRGTSEVKASEVRHSGRALGADNEAVYKGLLELADDEFRQLQDEGII